MKMNRGFFIIVAVWLLMLFFLIYLIYTGPGADSEYGSTPKKTENSLVIQGS